MPHDVENLPSSAATGLWRIAFEHGPPLLLRIDPVDPVWLRPAVVGPDGEPMVSGLPDGRWSQLDIGPHLIRWGATGGPEPVAGDGGPVPGVRVGYGVVVGRRTNHDAGWRTPTVVSIDRISSEDLTHSQRVGLRQRDLERARQKLRGRYDGDGFDFWWAWPPGWVPLVVDLDARLAALDPDYRIERIRGKFGILSFNATTSITREPLAAFEAAIRDAEQQSLVTCEECGEAGALCGDVEAGDLFLATLCEECANDAAAPAVPGVDPRHFQTVRAETDSP
ncbi:hypothetical protein E8D34_17055 [Nocardioides sp. GY 10113]|uniref:hypothetical protein n=1 Tax=Nocardioides sp. GY 10113 TaxID=2569761 RepID=UPI0010A7F41A|nr:hypothetical protein [Nocardioides sp. GY 10113]TIC82193.1 hypothetical protein E8D34_17055 [Nocardioides sp. GY 10113]